MPYIPHTPDEVREMLDVVGVSSIEELFAEIPAELRPKRLNLPPGLTEMAVRRMMERLAAKNRAETSSFLGGGFYDHYVPSASDLLISRGEFATAYTPYQPEASQGTLQAIFEYQTAASRLFEMDCSNAGVYDGGTALYEAVMMAMRHTRRKKVVVSEAVNPIYRIVLSTYTRNLRLTLQTVPHAHGTDDMAALTRAIDTETAAVVVQNPNFFGVIQDFTALFTTARTRGAVSIISGYPVLQTVLKTPGAMGADIATAEGQSLGLPLSFGGPFLGIMTCRKELVRQMPGRIAGRTKDAAGRTGYVLTLQAREQHIRRQKATSNICSNQALCALRALVNLCLAGDEGLARQAALSIENAHYAAMRLNCIPGVSLLAPDVPYGNEFTVLFPINGKRIARALMDEGIVPGFPLGRYYPGLENALLVCCTEKHGREEIDRLARRVEKAL
ncbi:aminomethyl-transferring glycine dehydrogenase subunit GcvPA [Desulfolutivibrio sulfoxidireducens]|uniref:aminomethyl-transferring glycine dehydrogenase subunit GcvPA n=1 Tax=Desulfolutivibrio sulfoxidireducens TaxID=2773299 RepID=UPI00159E5EA7|nr:aminomethyl-transferring glycine dehydrogenase subunit GcvPA [Desulfolutivibrio sulfoxidireducens]QLA15867.1 aminomethyl-transferring glycine dehydrogenase subunit GcvPA [Desulfolutivibrio sulfoxidireducens]QLA20231.1 aminomethyl-transferring glycine dehydrogenase subunit GcvPA [Desulfolutivibrio sulfoxidireducens]